MSAPISASAASASKALAELEAMAEFARTSELVVHVVVPRLGGVVAYARESAAREGVGICVDILSETIRIRFDGRPIR